VLLFLDEFFYLFIYVLFRVFFFEDLFFFCLFFFRFVSSSHGDPPPLSEFDQLSLPSPTIGHQGAAMAV